MAAKTFRDTRAWQSAMDAAVAVRDVSKNIDADQATTLTDPLRLTSAGIATTIADAWRLRTRPSEFVDTLGTAEGLCAKTLTWLELAVRIGAITKEQAAPLMVKFEEIATQLAHMIEQPEKWATSKETYYGTSNLVAEALKKQRSGTSGRQPKQS